MSCVGDVVPSLPWWSTPDVPVVSLETAFMGDPRPWVAGVVAGAVGTLVDWAGDTA